MPEIVTNVMAPLISPLQRPTRSAAMMLLVRYPGHKPTERRYADRAQSKPTRERVQRRMNIARVT